VATRNRSRLENRTLVLGASSRRPVGLGADMIDLGASPPIHTQKMLAAGILGAQIGAPVPWVVVQLRGE
jgi:hypothetical protein